MGATEEAGKAVSAVAETLKSTPLALALVIVNLTFLGFVTYVASNVSDTHRVEREYNQRLIQALMVQCVPAKDK